MIRKAAITPPGRTWVRAGISAIELEDLGGRTEVRLSQDNNATEEARQHSEKNWAAMLDGMKALLES